MKGLFLFIRHLICIKKKKSKGKKVMKDLNVYYDLEERLDKFGAVSYIGLGISGLAFFILILVCEFLNLTISQPFILVWLIVCGLCGVISAVVGLITILVEGKIKRIIKKLEKQEQAALINQTQN